MQREKTQPNNLIFWGAGATAALGMPTTAQQANFIRKLAGADEPRKALSERVADALLSAATDTEPWHSALCELVTILGDTEECFARIDSIGAEELEAMRRNWLLKPPQDDDVLREKIIRLRLIYDWPALKSVVEMCPASNTDRFKLNDLFNVLDMHLSFGVRTFVKKEPRQSDEVFLDSRRLIGAKKALHLMLIVLFHIGYQACLAAQRDVLVQYRDFAIQVGRRSQRQAIELAHEGYRLDLPEFYQGDVGFVSLNYDPIGLWIQFIANRELNQSAVVPYIGSPAEPLHLYHDFGHLIPARGIERKDAHFPWYPVNEATAQRLNEHEYSSGYRVRLTKFLFPHGCMCWRECPDCGKLSAYHGHTWELYANGLFPPPPLRAFEPSPCPDWIAGEERERRELGMVDARACLHCKTITYAHHTQMVMQSSFKSAPPSFLEEIQRELRATTMRADHIILMGYSLPLDDVTYRAFFSARRRRQAEVRCTIVSLDSSNPDWYGPVTLETRTFSNPSTVDAARDIFGKDNIRIYGGGIPKVFLDEDGQATSQKLEELLNWSSPVSA